MQAAVQCMITFQRRALRLTGKACFGLTASPAAATAWASTDAAGPEKPEA